MIQQGGDAARQAVAVLYQRYAPHFTAYVMRYCNCTDAVAQDVVQDAFVKMAQLLHSGRGISLRTDKGNGWMWAIVRNTAISLHRKPEHHRLVQLGSAGTHDEEKHVEPWRTTVQQQSDADCVRRAWWAF